MDYIKAPENEMGLIVAMKKKCSNCNSAPT